MQLLDLTLPACLAIMANPGVKGPRRLLQKLLLPRVDLVRVNFIANRKVRHRRLLPQRHQRNSRLQRRINLPSRPLAHLPPPFVANGTASHPISQPVPKSGPTSKGLLDVSSGFEDIRERGGE